MLKFSTTFGLYYKFLNHGTWILFDKNNYSQKIICLLFRNPLFVAALFATLLMEDQFEMPKLYSFFQANIWDDVHMSKIVPALLFNIESDADE